jgi:Tfp pilus assembly protein FimT
VQKQSKSKRQMRGYSIVELLVSMGIILTFSAFAVPSLLRSYRNYQMDDAASRVASQLKFTRFEAIRRNSNTNCLNKPQGAQNLLTMFTQDTKANANVNPNEKQIVFSGPGKLLDSTGVPNSAALTAAANAGPLTTISPANGTVTFDNRGAKVGGGASVYWIGAVNYGYRAVIVLPSGSVQVWSSASGAWQLLS